MSSSHVFCFHLPRFPITKSMSNYSCITREFLHRLAEFPMQTSSSESFRNFQSFQPDMETYEWSRKLKPKNKNKAVIQLIQLSFHHTIAFKLTLQFSFPFSCCRDSKRSKPEKEKGKRCKKWTKNTTALETYSD